jgi:endonuclease G
MNRFKRCFLVLAAGLPLILAGNAGAQDEHAPDCSALDAGIGLPVHLGEIPIRPLLCRMGYTLAYNPEMGTPDWVLELVTRENIEGEAKRRDNFHGDKEVERDVRVVTGDYTKSGFDRGHQAPAADMKWDQAAMDESFLMTNMAPQIGHGFNRGVWAHLEGDIRRWVERLGSIVVITGPVYGASPKKIGKNHTVMVPEAYFKIVYDPGRERAIGFLLPHKKLPSKSHGEHVVPIRDIEDKTGLDFFPALSRRKQNLLEMNTNNVWR